MATQDAQLVLNIINLNSRINRKLGGALSVHGLGVSEYQVLWQLKRAPRQTMRRIDLAEQVGLTASGITRLLNPMMKIGLIEKAKNSHDARVSLVTLSETGRRVLGEADTAVNYVAEALLSPLDMQRQQQLSECVDALA